MFYKVEELKKTAWKNNDHIENEFMDNPALLSHATRLCDLMNRIAEKWGRGKIPFTCAYRGTALNNKMGGHKNSSHIQACAIDLVIVLKDQDEFMQMLKEHFRDELDFAQNYIYRIEKGQKLNRNFVHLNIAEDGETPRQTFNTEIVKGNCIIFGSRGSSLELRKI